MGGAQKAREKCPNWCGERKQRQERDTWASQSSGGERPWLLRPVFTHTYACAHVCPTGSLPCTEPYRRAGRMLPWVSQEDRPLHCSLQGEFMYQSLLVQALQGPTQA